MQNHRCITLLINYDKIDSVCRLVVQLSLPAVNRDLNDEAKLSFKINIVCFD